MKEGRLYRFGRALLIPIFKLLFPYTVRNKNSIPSEGAYIVCCNHISLKDPVFLALGQRRQMFYMAKEELFHNKFLACLIRALGAFPVSRGTGDTHAINTAEHLLGQGKVLGIFIEGTRSRTGELLRPKSGAAMLAYKTGTPVIPASITPVKTPFPKLFHRLVVSYGEPLSVQDLGLLTGSGTEFREASRMIMDKISQLRERDKQQL